MRQKMVSCTSAPLLRMQLTFLLACGPQTEAIATPPPLARLASGVNCSGSE